MTAHSIPSLCICLNSAPAKSACCCNSHRLTPQQQSNNNISAPMHLLMYRLLYTPMPSVQTILQFFCHVLLWQHGHAGHLHSSLHSMCAQACHIWNAENASIQQHRTCMPVGWQSPLFSIALQHARRSCYWLSCSWLLVQLMLPIISSCVFSSLPAC